MSKEHFYLLKILQFIGHQDWIRFGIRYRIISKILYLFNIKSMDFEVEFFGNKYQGNLNSYLDWSVFFYGAYEKQELLMLRNLLKSKARPVFIDIGANIGHHSLFMSRNCEQIHAFEPYALVSKELEQKIEYNNIKNIHLHKVGLGETDCELDYFAPNGNNTGTGSFIAAHDIQNNQFFGKLQIVNADQYISNLCLDHIDLIKMDVEGFERNVLLGMRETMKKFRPILFMEYSHDTKLSFKNEEELMSVIPESYCVKTVKADKPFMYFFNSAKSTYDEFKFNEAGCNIIFLPLEAAGKLE